MTEPVEDLLGISGYALVYSELDKKNFWVVAKNYWEQYLSKVPDSAALVKFLINTLGHALEDFFESHWTKNVENAGHSSVFRIVLLASQASDVRSKGKRREELRPSVSFTLSKKF